jgi:hypothetical protein
MDGLEGPVNIEERHHISIANSGRVPGHVESISAWQTNKEDNPQPVQQEHLQHHQMTLRTQL